MPIETPAGAGYISDFVSTNPAASDGLNGGDDHLRNIKAWTKNTFPNANGPITGTPAKLNALTSTQYGRAVAVGSIHKFPKLPVAPILGSGGVTSGGPFEYLEADGSTWPTADYPELFAFFGTTFGGNGTTTFGVPDYKTLGKFLRSRTGSLAVGTFQTNQVGPHGHTTTITRGTLAVGVNPGGGHNHVLHDFGHTHDYGYMIGATPTGTGGNFTYVTATGGIGYAVQAQVVSNQTGITLDPIADHTHTTTLTGQRERWCRRDNHDRDKARSRRRRDVHQDLRNIAQ
jgi:microcystin-dependent protein